MTSRGRNLATTILLLVLVLFGGRWLADFLTVRWWAAAISPEALSAVTRWQLLGLSLDLIAVALASSWFVLQIWMVRSTIRAIHFRRDSTDGTVWQQVPERMMVLGAIVLGLLLGLLTGAGARGWSGDVALLIGAPRFGLEDIATGHDVGWLVSWYPVLQHAQQFVLTLGLLGLALTALLYLFLDGVAGNPVLPILKPERRFHYSLPMMLVALALLLGALLLPMHLATGVDAPIGDAAGSTRIAAGYAVAGMALATLILTLWWGISGTRHTLLVSTWAVLAVAQLVARVVVPAFTSASGTGAERARLMRQFDTLMYGIHLVEQTSAQDSVAPVVSIWDPAMLARWSARGSGALIGAGAIGADTSAAWLVATATPGDDAIEVTRLSATMAEADGRPMVLGAVRRIAAPRAVPGSDGWRRVDRGVRVGGLFRRVMLSWGLQAPGIMGLQPADEIDWLLDPVDRAQALVPSLQWRAVGAAWSNGDLVWVLTGLAATERAPLSTRVGFGSGTIAGLVPAAVAVLGASDGKATLHADSAADSIGAAWARWLGPALSPTSELAELGAELPYPMELFRRQLDVLEQPHWNIGVLATDKSRVATAPAWAPAAGAVQATLDAPDIGMTRVIMTASRQAEGLQISSATLSRATTPTTVSLSDAWLDLPVLGHLRDSISATGAEWLAGSVRWHRGPDGPLAWQPFAAAGEEGPRLLWLGTMTPGRIGGGRDPLTAWVTDSSSDAQRSALPDRASMALKTWIERADSALARGDLGAFARAWEAIRGIVLEAAPE